MGFRITTNMMMNSYRFNLQNSTKKLSDSRDQVLTQRKFGSYAEDPAAATLAFRLRRDYCKTTNYLNNTKDVYSKFNTAWNNLTGVVEKLSDATARVASIRGNNGTAGESRTALAVILRETSESVVHAMNQQLGDHFIFAGNDALNAPFTWNGETLMYRGIDVNSGTVEKPSANDPKWLEALDKIKQDMQNSKIMGTPADTSSAMQNWYTDMTDGNNTLTTPATDKALEWIEKFAAQDVKNGKMTASEADKWVEYYKDPTKGVPTDSKGNALKEPGWADRMAKVSEWDETETAQVWYNYYMGISNTRPDDTKYPEPNWLDNLEADAEAAVDNIPGLDPADAAAQKDVLQEWLAYYKRETKDKPLMEQSTTVTGWGTVDPDDPKAYPEDLPKTSDGLTGSDLEWFKYYDDKRQLAKLETMAGEEMYIDLGMGAEESSPNSPVKGTYFNNALSGIDYIGYGMDEDGDPKNLAIIMRELADVFETWDEDTQSYNPKLAKNSAEGLTSGELEAKAFRLMDKLKAAQEHTTEKWVELDANSVFLQANEAQLTTQQSDLNIQILDVEQVDLADAITSFSWNQYCYNAALKIGNQLLSQSLIDYMN